MSGIKATVALTANVAASVYSPGGTILGSYKAIICNQGAGAAMVRLGTSIDGSVDWTTDTVRPDVLIPAGGYLEVEGLLAYGANTIHALSNQSNVNVVIMGVQ
jgi:hypothetical protein